MTAIEQLAALVVDCRPDERTRAEVRRHVIDTIGAWISATGTAEGKALLAFRRPDAALVDRVAVHCALARLSEIDDIHLGAMVTPGAIVVPAALAIASTIKEPRAGELFAAIVAGYETMIRFAAAIDGPTVLYRGIWPSYFAAPIGVAAVAARLLQLDTAKTAHALALALTMAAPGVGHHVATTTARWLAIGHAAARGLQAAFAAQAGFTGDLMLADGAFLKNVYGLTPDVAVLAGGLGEVAIRQVSFKPWCAARQTMAATQALKELLAAGVAGETIRAIEAWVLPPHHRMIDHGVAAGDRFSSLTSVQYQMAVAVLAPATACELGPPAGGITPFLAALMERIMVRADEGLLAQGYPKAWAARVSVTTATCRHERTVTHVPGDPARPLSDCDLQQKFHRLAAPVLGSERARTMFDQVPASLDHPATLLHFLEQIGTEAD